MSPFRFTHPRHIAGLALLGLSLTAGLPAAAHAHGGRGRGHRGPPTEEQRARMEAHMKEARARLLREEVGLDEARAAQAEEALGRFDAERHGLMKRHHEARKALKALLESDSDDQPAYEKALDALLQTQDGLAALRRAQIDALRELLTPKERARMLRGLHEMKRSMFERHHGKGRPGGPMDGPGEDGPDS